MILFCEYVISGEHRDAFRAWIQDDPARWSDAQLLESTAQPGVYVEIWALRNFEDGARKEKERREGRSWRAMEQWVKGGRDGLRIWTFRPVIDPE